MSWNEDYDKAYNDIPRMYKTELRWRYPITQKHFHSMSPRRRTNLYIMSYVFSNVDHRFVDRLTKMYKCDRKFLVSLMVEEAVKHELNKSSLNNEELSYIDELVSQRISHMYRT